MNITIVTGPFLPVPPAPHGAVERVWRELSEEFARRGHAVTVLCRGHSTQLADEVAGGVHYIRRCHFVRSRSVYRDLVKDGLYSLRLSPLLPRADVLIVNAFWLPTLASFASRRWGEVVVNIQRMPKGQMWLYRRVARVSVVSHAVAREVARQCPRLTPRVRVIPNPIDTAVFAPPRSRRCWDGKRVVLFAGRLHPEKGVGLLIDAFKLLRRQISAVQLWVIGPHRVDQGGGGESYLEELRAKAQGEPVEFLPPVFEKQKLAELYRAAHVFCYPSLAERGESFGVAPLEAMGTGLVPVVSSLECFQDFITAGETGLSFDHRGADAPRQLAEQLAAVVGDPDRTENLGGRAAREAARFGLAEVADRYLADFEELLGRQTVAWA